MLPSTTRERTALQRAGQVDIVATVIGRAVTAAWSGSAGPGGAAERLLGGIDEDAEMTMQGSLPNVIAEAVVTRALEIFAAEEDCPKSTPRMDDALLASEYVRAAIAQVPGSHDAEEWKQVVTRLAISLAREVVKLWSDAYPNRVEPLSAVEAAEAWVACPCTKHADDAAETMLGAARQAMTVWRVSPKEAAWAGRTAAWAADAPKYGWQAVAAIGGACRSTSPEEVLAAAVRIFSSELRSR